MSEPQIKVKIANVSRVYENGDGIHGIDLAVYEGEILTLLGPSGCGKSTLLRCLGGFNACDEGTIFIDNQDMTRVAPEKRTTSMVFQGYNLWNHMTVYENLAWGLKLRKVSKKECQKKVAAMLELLQLPGVEKKYPTQLSGGQQQRIAIGRSLILEPAVLLMDEPYSALDAKIRQQMREELKRIQQETGVTVVFVTHDQEEALSLSNRIVVMEKGKIAQVGTPAEIYEQPVNRYTASFIGEMNFVEDAEGEVAFRPEDTQLVPVDTPNSWTGEVVQVRFNGPFAVMSIALPNQTSEVKIHVSKFDVETYLPGQKIAFCLTQAKHYTKA